MGLDVYRKGSLSYEVTTTVWGQLERLGIWISAVFCLIEINHSRGCVSAVLLVVVIEANCLATWKVKKPGRSALLVVGIPET